MKQYYVFILINFLGMNGDFANAAARKPVSLICKFIETEKGDTSHQTVYSLLTNVGNSSVMPNEVSTKVVKDIKFSIFGSWGSISSKKKLETLIELTDTKSGVKSESISLGDPSGKSGSGNLSVILSRSNGDAVAVICDPDGK